LFLSDAPLFCLVCLSVQIGANQFRPLDAGFCFQQAMFTIKRDHVIQFTRIDANAVARELLATHRVPASRNANRQTLARRGTNNLGKFISGARS
jgi:hypothetical protein